MRFSFIVRAVIGLVCFVSDGSGAGVAAFVNMSLISRLRGKYELPSRSHRGWCRLE